MILKHRVSLDKNNQDEEANACTFSFVISTRRLCFYVLVLVMFSFVLVSLFVCVHDNEKDYTESYDTFREGKKCHKTGMIKF